MNKNVCCIFERKEGRSGNNLRQGLEKLEVLKDSDRHLHLLYHCRNCGELVLYKREEIEDFVTDREDIYETLFPVYSPEDAHAMEAELPFGGVPSGRPVWCNHWDSEHGEAYNWLWQIVDQNGES